MPRGACWWMAAVFVCMCGSDVFPRGARELTFEERVRAQEAIERLNYSYQAGATLPFEQAIPQETIERKVTTYLKQSVALQRVWNTPVTRPMLEAELSRIARETQMPDRLLQTYAALGNDALLILECFARPSLVDRLSRSFLAQDHQVGSQARDEAKALRTSLVEGASSPRSDDSHRIAVTVTRQGGGDSTRLVTQDPTDRTLGSGVAGGAAISLPWSEYARWRSHLPAAPGEIGPLEEEETGFVFQVVLDEGTDYADIAAYRFARPSWEEWWAANESSFDPAQVASTASPEAFALPVPPPGALPPTCMPEDSWASTRSTDFPDRRSEHTALWTGREMIVWGGTGPDQPFGTYLSTGSRYDPLTNTWRTMSTVNAPSGRTGPAAVWTGSEMIVWGGGYKNTGGRYDPATDTWRATSTVGAPSSRDYQSAVWTGTRMIVWGGRSYSSLNLDTGALYDPVSDTWSPMAPGLEPRHSFSAVWTGTRMLVWGGYTPLGPSGTGALYDPAADSWARISAQNAPSPSSTLDHKAVWTGTEMVIWGGRGTGGRYNPDRDAWASLSSAESPSARTEHTMIWTGSEVIIWGGYSTQGDLLKDGARYDPAGDRWLWLGPVGLEERANHSAVWTGREMIVWGGTGPTYPYYQHTGGRYDIASGTWSPTFVSFAAQPRSSFGSVWTGTHMLLWGGATAYGYVLSDGLRYDPLTDSWTRFRAYKSARHFHTTIWTGRWMVIWGGVGSSFNYQNTGAIYDPALDVWYDSIPTSGAPSARTGHTAVWTGTEMIVWGGGAYGTAAPDAAAWNATTGQWRTLAAAGAPEARSGHSAVWTGTEMIIWGGVNNSYQEIASGARYSPVTDSWTPLSLSGAPQARRYASGVWTGSLMIIWGGLGNDTALSTGASYDPLWNTWGPIPPGPSGRYGHSAIWTGSKMILWGGFNRYDDLNTGGVFSPASSTWASTSTQGAPAPMSGHAAVWTGQAMVVWRGGAAGVYSVLSPADNDQDGVLNCEGDCDDSNPSIHPGAPELCNARDDDCDGLTDDNFHVGEVCFEGQGMCWAVGEWVCAPDQTGPLCTAEPGTPTEEICDGKDNDCDGSTDENDGDHDSVSDCSDNCPFTPNPGQEDTAHRNGLGDACDDPDGDGVFDDVDTCPDTLNPEQEDGDLDSAGDACDICPSIPNPSQSESVACLQVGGSGPCLGAAMALVGAERSGEVRVSGLLQRLPEEASVEVNISSCVVKEDLQISLNGIVVGTVRDQSLGCECVPAIQSVSLDPAAVAASWRLAGGNEFTLRKGSTPGWYGTWVGWVRLRLGAGDDSRSVCLFDDGGGTCTEADQCSGGSTDDALDVRSTIQEPLLQRTQSISVSYNGSVPPLLIDIRSLPDGAAELCALRHAPGTAGASDCARFQKEGALLLAVNGAACGPPVADAGADATAECTSPAGASILLDGSGSTDPKSGPESQGGIESYEWFEQLAGGEQRPLGTGATLGVPLPLGRHEVVLRITDTYGLQATDGISIEVADTVAPGLNLSAEPDTLWPPNHRMVPVAVSVAAADLCDASPVVSLDAVTSSEQDDAPGDGDGHTIDDVGVVPQDGSLPSILLRAEREGAGMGRLYGVRYVATDASGNLAAATKGVFVPHDRSGSSEPVDVELAVKEGGAVWLQWSIVPEALSYNVIRGTLSRVTLLGSFTLLEGTVCLARRVAGTALSVAGEEDPQPGGAYIYLVEYDDGLPHGYGTSSGGGDLVVGSGDSCR